MAADEQQVGLDRVADPWGPRTPHARGTTWPVRVDQHLAAGVHEDDVSWVRSACTLCSNGCACDLAVRDGRLVGIRGRADDRVNHGRLGPKGLYGQWVWQQHPDRLEHPLVREGGELVETDWDTAMSHVVERSRALLDERGPLSHGFYTSGQLTLEEYWALATIGKAGIGTPHMDGNTRLCTATSAAAFKESFGADGQPGAYTDVDHCDALFLFGHNVAETQTVLWSRVLDRVHGDDPPALVVVDPRRTAVAAEAVRTGGVHLAVRPGTNLAMVNGLAHELLTNGWVDDDWVRAHTVGLDGLRGVVEDATPEVTAAVCEVPADDVRRAAAVFGTSTRVLSTVLQGFYQSHQATAASCGVNNLHLLRGMLGRPGCGVLQMNGQPTAQNTRECGADGDLPGFRNWENESHVQQLADHWDVDLDTVPHWAPPTHALQIVRYVEQGSIGFLWVNGTNPAVSLPDLARVRRVLGGDRCFVVVSDLFRTETTELADVVLPAAGWTEKAGCSTNADRTVHLSERAVDPPGEARSDFDAFLDYARRMGLRDRSGRPLPRFTTPEEAFDDWARASRGRPCDYSGLSWDVLRRSPSGLPWPVTAERPGGTDRLYVDGVFATAADRCETYGHDLLTGAARTPEQHAAVGPDGRAFLAALAWTAPHQQPDEEHPLELTTGRTVHHFHTRTKTRRSRPLHEAAPAAWVEMAQVDAEVIGAAAGDLVRVSSPRGSVEVVLRVGAVRPGTVFVPFHYGTHPANELVATVWDPVSKQPLHKSGACRVERVGRVDGDDVLERDVRVAAGGTPPPAPTTTSRTGPLPAQGYPDDPSGAGTGTPS